jgi:hypothetical protein
VQRRKSLRDGEADAGAAPAIAVRRLVVAIEDSLLLVQRDAGTFVRDGHKHLVEFLTGAHQHTASSG